MTSDSETLDPATSAQDDPTLNPDGAPPVGPEQPAPAPAAPDGAPAAVRHDFEDGTRLDLTIAGQSYPVFLLDKPAEILAEFLAASSTLAPGNIALICDENTSELFGLRYEADFIKNGFTVVVLTVPAGETTKSWDVAGQLVTALSNSGVGRADCIVALGGGMISDLSGFVATVYERGLDLCLLPTTLLALVDAAVGGKVAVNRDEAKNLAGAFKQPRAIAADLSVLKSLTEVEYRSGLAELVKTAILSGEDFLAFLEDHVDELRARDAVVLREAVVRAMCFKAQIVADDPYDKGLRACLNYGHTIGHALEQVSDYTIPHGLGVAEGMRFAARLSVQLYGASPEFVLRQDALLDALGLAALEVSDYRMSDLKDAMQRDKKNGAGEIRFVLVREPGVVGTAPVDTPVLFSHLRAWMGIKTYTPPEPPAEPEQEAAAPADETSTEPEPNIQAPAGKRSDEQPPVGRDDPARLARSKDQPGASPVEPKQEAAAPAEQDPA
ncbi:MAG: 3-dehydroquinate synthase [Coriobacteriia bacterium]|nr:3-dehydroquinate synthase [Coriobacteriia bacterium]